jgi:hypothetical protein
VVALLPPEQLVPIYWGIAFLGIAWPWMMIGVALVGDLLTRACVKAARSPRPAAALVPVEAKPAPRR